MDFYEYKYTFLVSPNNKNGKIRHIRRKMKEFKMEAGFGEEVGGEGNDFRKPKNYSYAVYFAKVNNGNSREQILVVLHVRILASLKEEFQKIFETSNYLHRMKNSPLSPSNNQKIKKGIKTECPVINNKINKVVIRQSSPLNIDFICPDIDNPNKAYKEYYEATKKRISIEAERRTEWGEKYKQIISIPINMDKLLVALNSWVKKVYKIDEAFIAIRDVKKTNNSWAYVSFVKNEFNITLHGIANIELTFNAQMSDQEKSILLLNGLGAKRGLGMGFLWPVEEAKSNGR